MPLCMNDSEYIRNINVFLVMKWGYGKLLFILIKMQSTGSSCTAMQATKVNNHQSRYAAQQLQYVATIASILCLYAVSSIYVNYAVFML